MPKVELRSGGNGRASRSRAVNFLRGVAAIVPQKGDATSVALRHIPMATTEREQSLELVRLIHRIQELTRELGTDFPSALQLVSSMRLEDLTRATITGFTPDYKTEWVNATAAGDTQVVERVEGKKIRGVAFSLNNGGGSVATIHFRSNQRPITSDKDLAADGGGMVAAFSQGGIWFETAVGEALNINLAAAGTIGVDVTYIEVEVDG
mgnify:CR=1 FL=1